MRDIAKCIKKLKEIIPMNEPVQSTLSHLLNKTMYTSPESMGSRWHELGIVLSNALGPPGSTVWKIRVSNIIEDRDEI